MPDALLLLSLCRFPVPNVLQNLAQPQVDANNSLTVPSVNGKRLDQTTAWIVEVSVTISPIGLAERPEPCAAYRQTCTCTTAFTSTTVCLLHNRLLHILQVHD